MLRGLQREDPLHCHINSRDLEFFKEDLQHFAFVLGRVHVGFSEQDGTLVGGDFEEGEGVLP